MIKENILIKGDSIQELPLLLDSFQEKVKMIYQRLA